MLTDLDIAQSAKMKKITEVSEYLGIKEEELSLYGKYIAKVEQTTIKRVQDNPNGTLIFVTAITPTPAGEGKTTTTIGLSDALNDLGKKAMAVIREPSLGPVFGVKGGAAGGGYAQVVPMEEINLQFTGDIPAVGIANNLLAAMTDNHIQHGNELGIDIRRVSWRRVIDMNDRALRQVIVALGGTGNGYPRETGFDITAASEIMAILGMAKNMDDLKERLGRIIIGYTRKREPITAKDLKATGAMAIVLRNAIKPNLVQTLENHPVFIHGGPFANIAHGASTITSIKLALKLSDYVITEGGFASDLGGEKFMDIVSRIGELHPSAVVLVATIRALKMHGGLAKDELKEENMEALKKGLANLGKHIENMRIFGLPVVVALNKFITDSDTEIALVRDFVKESGARFALSEVWEKGGEGGKELANEVIEAIQKDKNNFHFLYELDDSIEEKIYKIATNMYGADDVVYTDKAKKDIKLIKKIGYSNLPICMAKTQLSLSDNPKLIGRPTGFKITIREVRLSAGAGFIVPIAGSIMTMPGLPKHPAAENMDISNNGRISGLF
jgi:formate--tetrahydrofolate ligase